MAEIYNQMIIVGNLGADPELKYFESGAHLLTFNIAIYQGKDKNTGEPRESTWFTIKAWGNTESTRFVEIADELSKGSKVRVTGKLNHESWIDKATGTKRVKHVCELRYDEHTIEIIPREPVAAF